jgi:hypothetical protein
MDLAEILKNWEANPGADPESIKKAEASLGLTFPDDYRQFPHGRMAASGTSDRVAEATPMRSTSPWSVGEVPFIGMDLEYLEPIATSFSRFLERLTHDE